MFRRDIKLFPWGAHPQPISTQATSWWDLSEQLGGGRLDSVKEKVDYTILVIQSSAWRLQVGWCKIEGRLYKGNPPPADIST